MKTIAEIKNNEAQNGIEIYFKVYPLTGTKETMKKNGFRWNRKKGCWYAIKSMTTESIAGIMADTTMTEYENIAKKTGEEVKVITANKARSTLTKPKTDIINLDNLGENAPLLYGAELSKAIRDDLKRRGVTGVTVRKRDITYDTGITVTVKASSEDFASLEEAENRYGFGQFCCDASRRNGIGFTRRWISPVDFENMTDTEKEQIYREFITEKIKGFDSVRFGWSWNDNRDEYWEITTAFYNKLRAVYLIANQWNYNNNDSMTDYYDVGYYLDIDIKQPEEIEIMETMTDDERKAYEAEIAKRKAEEEARLQAYKEEQARLEEKRKEHDKWLAEATERIKNNITIEDLRKEEQIYINNLKMGIGKECNLDELKETIAEKHYTQDALITRKVTFTDDQAYNDFCKLFLYDFEWLQGMGGTATEDVRLSEDTNIYNLTEEQRESVEFYSTKCVAVYLNDTLSLVIDPQGYSYARYVMLPDEESETYPARFSLEVQRKNSEEKEPFYFPETVEKQTESITVGQEITVYQCDGWILNSIYGGFGTVEKVYPGNYAQYKGVYIDLMQGKKKRTVFIRDGKKALIYEGILPPLPKEVTETKINDNMSLMHNEDELFKNAYRYYKDRDILPIVDTWQR